MPTAFRILSFLILSLVVSLLFADEAPPYRPYDRESANKQYVAKVTIHEEDKDKNRYDARWVLTIYKKTAKGEEKLWTVPFFHRGYWGGALSDDGQVLVDAEQWYYHHEPAVIVYSKGKEVGRILGKDFGVPESKREKTESHELWLSENSFSTELRRENEFVKTTDGYDYKIYTIDGNIHLIDCKTGKIKKTQKQEPETVPSSKK